MSANIIHASTIASPQVNKPYSIGPMSNSKSLGNYMYNEPKTLCKYISQLVKVDNSKKYYIVKSVNINTGIAILEKMSNNAEYNSLLELYKNKKVEGHTSPYKIVERRIYSSQGVTVEKIEHIINGQKREICIVISTKAIDSYNLGRHEYPEKYYIVKSVNINTGIAILEKISNNAEYNSLLELYKNKKVEGHTSPYKIVERRIYSSQGVTVEKIEHIINGRKREFSIVISTKAIDSYNFKSKHETSYPEKDNYKKSDYVEYQEGVEDKLPIEEINTHNTEKEHETSYPEKDNYKKSYYVEYQEEVEDKLPIEENNTDEKHNRILRTVMIYCKSIITRYNTTVQYILLISVLLSLTSVLRRCK